MSFLLEFGTVPTVWYLLEFGTVPTVWYLLEFGTVPTVWYFFVFHFVGQIKISFSYFHIVLFFVISRHLPYMKEFPIAKLEENSEKVKAQYFK